MNTQINSKIESALREILKLDSSFKITDESKLKDDLGLDSMSLLTFLMQLEEMIDGFVVDPENLELSDLETVGTVTGYIDKQVKNRDK